MLLFFDKIRSDIFEYRMTYWHYTNLCARNNERAQNLTSLLTFAHRFIMREFLFVLNEPKTNINNVVTHVSNLIYGVVAMYRCLNMM